MFGKNKRVKKEESKLDSKEETSKFKKNKKSKQVKKVKPKVKTTKQKGKNAKKKPTRRLKLNDIKRIRSEDYRPELRKKITDAQADVKGLLLQVYYHVSIRTDILDKEGFKKYPKAYKFLRNPKKEYELLEFQGVINAFSKVLAKEDSFTITCLVEDSRNADIYYFELPVKSKRKYDLIKFYALSLEHFEYIYHPEKIEIELNKQVAVEKKLKEYLIMLQDIVDHEDKLTAKERKVLQDKAKQKKEMQEKIHKAEVAEELRKKTNPTEEDEIYR